VRDAGGTIDPRTGQIWITVNAAADFDRGRKIFHHEMFHLFEHRATPTFVDRDRAWTKLKPDGFRYGRHNERLADGFVSKYSMTDDREDKAEVYTHIVWHPPDLCSLYKNDAIVLDKARLIRQRIRDVIGADTAAYIDAIQPCLAQ
jgi:hypothetical protein